MQTTHGWLALSLLLLAGCSEAVAEPARSWFVRLDEATAAIAPGRIKTLPDGGVEVQDGPNATLWRQDAVATGAYRLSVRITQRNAGVHAHGAGLVFGGRDVEGEHQTYTYFLVNGDGTFLIKARSAEATSILAPWTAHAAIQREDGELTARNELAIEVDASTTKFFVNGREVHSARTAELQTDGRYGCRLVHDQYVKFENLVVTAKR